MKIQAEIFSIVFIILASIGIFAYGGYCVKRLDLAEKPTGFENITIQFVTSIRNLINLVMGKNMRQTVHRTSWLYFSIWAFGVNHG